MNKVISVLISILVFCACNHSVEIRKSDPLESGRGFIEASLKEDYDAAQQYILPDSTNMQFFNGLKYFNSKRSSQEKEGYRNANILVDSIQKISDSVTIISYSNTYKNKPSKLRMVKKGNEWLVDFKYSITDSI